jgi:uncharacterized protein (DUF2384 family)
MIRRMCPERSGVEVDEDCAGPFLICPARYYCVSMPRTATTTTADVVRRGELAGRMVKAVTAVGGQQKAADLLGVPRTVLAQLQKGDLPPDPEIAVLLLDLDYVLVRSLLVFTPRVARRWLVGANNYLDGARPIDVLRLRGCSSVIEALDAAQQGAYR